VAYVMPAISILLFYATFDILLAYGKYFVTLDSL
jgi:hypothetical protein